MFQDTGRHGSVRHGGRESLWGHCDIALPPGVLGAKYSSGGSASLSIHLALSLPGSLAGVSQVLLTTMGTENHFLIPF